MEIKLLWADNDRRLGAWPLLMDFACSINSDHAPNLSFIHLLVTRYKIIIHYPQSIKNHPNQNTRAVCSFAKRNTELF